jgi:hypothetical protein
VLGYETDVVVVGVGESITSLYIGGRVGAFTSLALDDIGHSVTRYYDLIHGELKMLHCGSPDCIVDTTPPVISTSVSDTIMATCSDVLDNDGSASVTYHTIRGEGTHPLRRL